MYMYQNELTLFSTCTFLHLYIFGSVPKFLVYIYVHVPNLADLFSASHFAPYQRAGNRFLRSLRE